MNDLKKCRTTTNHYVKTSNTARHAPKLRPRPIPPTQHDLSTTTPQLQDKKTIQRLQNASNHSIRQVPKLPSSPLTKNPTMPSQTMTPPNQPPTVPTEPPSDPSQPLITKFTSSQGNFHPNRKVRRGQNGERVALEPATTPTTAEGKIPHPHQPKQN